MFWIIVAYHIVLMIVLVKGNFANKAISLGLLLVLYLPSIVFIARNISPAVELVSTLREYGFSAISWGLPELYFLPIIFLGIGLVLWAAETVFSLNVPYLGLSGLRFINWSFGLNAGVWLAYNIIGSWLG